MASLSYSGQRDLFIVNTIFIVVSVLSVALRFASRLARRLHPGIDDWLCAAALVAYLGQAAIVYEMIFVGHAGYPTAAMTPEAGVEFLKLTTAVQVPYALVLLFTRLSIIVLLHRIFGVSKNFAIVCFALGFLTVAWFLYVFIQTFALCQPFEANWNKIIPARCGNQTAVYLGICYLGLGIDVCIFVSPLPMVWRLSMGRLQKIGLTIVFGLGAFDIVAAAMRAVAVEKNFEASTALIWGILEPAFAIVIACAPMFKQLWDGAKPHMSYLSSRSWYSRSDTKSGNPYASMPDEHIELASKPLDASSATTRAKSVGTAARSELGRPVHPHPEDQVGISRDVHVYHDLDFGADHFR